jgi:hypothetical protein
MTPLQKLNVLLKHYKELYDEESEMELKKIWKCKIDTIEECIRAIEN